MGPRILLESCKSLGTACHQTVLGSTSRLTTARRQTESNGCCQDRPEDLTGCWRGNRLHVVGERYVTRSTDATLVCKLRSLLIMHRHIPCTLYNLAV